MVIAALSGLACGGAQGPIVHQGTPQAPIVSARSGHMSDGIFGGFIYPSPTDSDVFEVDAPLRTPALTRYFTFTVNVQLEGFRDIAMRWVSDASGATSAVTRVDGPCAEGPSLAHMVATATAQANRTVPAAWSAEIERRIDGGEAFVWPTCSGEAASRFLPALPGGTGTDWAEWDVSVLLPAALVEAGGTLELRAVNMANGIESQATPLHIKPSPILVAAVGDSVVWGQGLREADKVYSKLAEEVRQRYGDPRLVVRAHSGAILGPNGRVALAASCSTAPDPRTASGIDNGEVPSNVLIPCQIIDVTQRACNVLVPDRRPFPNGRRIPIFNCLGPRDPTTYLSTFDEGPRYDYVLLNGCINDIGPGDMVRGLRGYDNDGTLDSAIDRACDLRNTLPDLDVFFPQATVAITAYHRVLAQNINPRPQSCKPPPRVQNIGCEPPCHGCPPPPKCPPTIPDACDQLPDPAATVCGVLETPPRWPRAADRADRFFARSRQRQREAVDAMAAAWRGNGRPVFVSLDDIFPSDTGAFGPSSLIWECSNSPMAGDPVDAAFRAVDDVRTARMSECALKYPRSSPPDPGVDNSRRACDRTSMFHPNARGAQKTAEEVIRVISDAGRFPSSRPD